MEQDKQKDELLNSTSIPPRSTIHQTKPEKAQKQNKRGQLQILISSLVFILIIASVLYYTFTPSSENNEVLKNPSNNEAVIDQDNNETSETNDSTDGTSEETTDGTTETNNELNEQEASESEPDQVPSTDESDNQSEEATTDTSQDKIHVIEKGENLYKISKKYYNSGEFVDALAKYNGLSDSGEIYAGFKLKIPDKKLLQQ